MGKNKSQFTFWSLHHIPEVSESLICVSELLSKYFCSNYSALLFWVKNQPKTE